MTIDDETSVYVGNLPYNATEDTIRSVFNLYGQIIAVKLINDRGVGGKCYGFVTYTNPRSAVDAINDMDGRTVNGRVVKVNEVKTRGGRSSFSHDNHRQNNNKDMELDRSRDRDRDRDYGRVRDRSRDQNREFSRERDHGKERGFDHSRDIDRTRDRFIDRDRGYDRDKDMDDIKHEREKDYDQTARDHRSENKYNDQTAKLTNDERHSREHPSGSSHEDPDQVAKQLDVSRHKIEELQKEVFCMEELVKEKGDYVSKLHEKSQKLEDALASAKKLTSNRKKQLIKLHKCFLNIKEYREKLRSSEEELQYFVGSSMKELENQVGLDTDGLLAYGNGVAD